MPLPIDDFTASLLRQDRSAHTVDAYRSDVSAFFAWLTSRLNKEVPPIEVTTFDIQRYRNHLLDQGRQPAGINRRLAALRTFFAWAISQGHAATNPVAGVQGIGQAPRAPKALSAQDVYRLQRTAAGQRQLAQAKAGPGVITPAVISAIADEALLNLLLYAGLRVSEACGLQVGDIDSRRRLSNARDGKGSKVRHVMLGCRRHKKT